MRYYALHTNPLVSIVVPVYGTEQYLSKCVGSILAQTYSHIEIILVDDQSPDNCPKICDSFAERDSRVTVIHQENKGVSGARNAGMRCASGEYIMFVDSDDELYPDAVRLLLEDVEAYGADIVSAVKDVVLGDNSIKKISDDSTPVVYKGDEPLLLSLSGDRNTNSACAKLFCKRKIDGIFFEEGKSVNEDGFFVFQCYLRRPVLVQHNISVYRYNYREGSGSKQAFSDAYLAMLFFCEQKKKLVAAQLPQYINQAHNMEVRTGLQFLDLLCRTGDKKYKKLQSDCIKTVKKFYRYHRPVNSHHRSLARIVKCGLYPVYKIAFRLKYHL